MSFNFLNPAVLWTVPLVFIPLILHLFLKRPPKTIYFSDLRFLKSIYKKTRPRKRIQEWIILALRMLSILFLLLFFARPVLNWGGNLGNEDTAAVVILMDASYSMRYQISGVPVWNRAVQLAKITLDSLKERDRSALIVFSDEINFLSGHLSNKHDELMKHVDQLQPSFRQTNFLPPLQHAYQLLSNSGASNKSIIVLSDMAEHGWLLAGASADKWQSSIKSYDPNVRILYTDFQEHENNVSIRKLQMTPDFYSGMIKLQVKVKNWGPQTAAGLPVFVDFESPGGHSQRQSEATVDLAPPEEKLVTCSAPSPEGLITGKVGIMTDSLAEDNQIYFARPTPQKTKVLCVEERSGIAALTGESYYLRQALTAPPSQFDVTTVTMDEAQKTDLSRFQAVVLVNPSEALAGSMERLRHYVRKGGAIFLTLGERSGYEPGIGETGMMDGLFPCAFRYARDTPEATVRITKDNSEELKQFDSSYELQKIKLNKIVQTAVHENADIWMTIQDGTPLLIFSEDGRIAVWTSSIDRSWNNLISKPIFAPLMRFVIRKITAYETMQDGSFLYAGETFRKKSAENESAVEIFSPKDDKIKIQLFNKEWVSEPVEMPGFYKIIRSGKTSVERFAVNVNTDGDESCLRKMTVSKLFNVLSETQWMALKTGDGYRPDLIVALRGKELSRSLIAFAALFLIGEMVLTRKKR